MNENVIARGKRIVKAAPFRKMVRLTAVLAAALLILGILLSVVNAGKAVKNHTHTKYCYKYSYRSDFNNDNKNNNLKSYKMDCAYTGGALKLGVKNYFRGGIMLPLLVVIVGTSSAYVKRSKSRSYVLNVTEQEINVMYNDKKTLNIPLCSVFTVEKGAKNKLTIVTSENTYTFQDMVGCDDVYGAIKQLMPAHTIKGPANNEQVLTKAYPPAIKPLLLLLLILIGVASVIGAIASEMIEVLLIGAIPFVIILPFYLAAKTPYLVVTDKRVFYVSDFGRKLSIPMNKITVAVTHKWFGQLHIAAPTGRIYLFGVRNTAEVHDIITAVINEMQ